MQISAGVEEAGHFNVGFNVFGRKKYKTVMACTLFYSFVYFIIVHNNVKLVKISYKTACYGSAICLTKYRIRINPVIIKIVLLRETLKNPKLFRRLVLRLRFQP